MFLLSAFPGPSIITNIIIITTIIGDVCSFRQAHEVVMQLLAQRVHIGFPPGCGVAMATVTLGGGGVHQDVRGINERGEKVVTELC